MFRTEMILYLEQFCLLGIGMEVAFVFIERDLFFLRLTTLVRPCYTTFSIGALYNYPNWCLMQEVMMKIIPIGRQCEEAVIKGRVF